MKNKVYFYLALNGISQIGDAIFLFYVVLGALQFPHGGFLSGVFFALDGIVRILIIPFTAVVVDKIPYEDRWRWAIWGSLLLICLSILPAIFLPSSYIGYLWLCCLLLLMSIVSNFSNQLRMELPYRLKNSSIFSLSKFSSFGNLSYRGVYVIAPIVAVMIPQGIWWPVVSINVASFAFMVFASWLGHVFFRKLHNGTEKLDDCKSSGAIILLARWNSAFLLLINFAIGGVTLLLTYLMKYSDTDIYNIMSPVSALYLGTVISFSVILVIPKIHFVETANINTVLFGIGSTFATLAFVVTQSSILLLVTLFITGLLYGASLIAMAPAITNQFSRSSSMISYVSYSQAFGRIGSILSSLFVGIFIDAHYNPHLILFIMALMGTVFVIFMYILKKSLNID